MIEIQTKEKLASFKPLTVTLDIDTEMQLALLSAILNSGSHSADRILRICGTYKSPAEIKWENGFKAREWADLTEFIIDNNL
ncbi:MAG: hypothetical protein JKY67_14015 [Pseudomonadales bacterium]|nr:hypothetical protein [Pseudomonadales bacterium]